MLGANGIVAGGISIITGAGLAAQMEGKGRVAVSFFGDGASNAGPFHECLNIAAAWKLPMIYVCENNLYAAQTAKATNRAVGRARAGEGPTRIECKTYRWRAHTRAPRAAARATAPLSPAKNSRHRTLPCVTLPGHGYAMAGDDTTLLFHSALP
jgi:pyruvate dehydrogenase E1 component alpha subunit